MRILFACGGTGGHINPALAVANYIRSQQPDAVIRFAGNPNGMEARLVPQAGYEMSTIHVLGFQRRLSLHNLKNNCMAACYLVSSGFRAREILKEFQPDVVVGTGGYVSGPILRSAAKLKIPTVTHESNAYPGVTTRLLCRYADKVLLAVEDAKKYLDPGREYIVTGNPVREEIIFASRREARQKLNIPQDGFCLLSFGGSLGAQRVNEAVAELIAWHTKAHPGKIHHIHATGSYGVELLPRLLKERGVDYQNIPTLDIREYINDMADCMAAADLVISRAGALTLSELEAAGRASILIPSPNVAANHQYHNAMALANRNAAVVVEEKNLTGDWLCREVEDFFLHPDKLSEYSRNAAGMAVVDAVRRIAQVVEELANQ
ncbi:MAG: undecaprenyldiphospho-muramoylpentapeptide beta-N-acetylglucosaminyltransferase [Oscillospiraceae bacterium]|jgi:UDP-N-acetylglucosamine--N-acetylmuramyl-(pentapeptide) pyrophosphoryl-undecaprenol N-acetylglucosamine transferase|nr:undecaprenyldiphospho-muramoylpentapeptide beta-N-acetylglucosaminyltransferase [Oscillospiraceae bacterium]